MYNRYVAQQDGSYRKTRIPDSGEPEPSLTIPPSAYAPEFPPNPEKASTPMGIGSFLKTLLPEHLDTEDLIVILLLLLISERKEDESNQAMLTLGAYLFL